FHDPEVHPHLWAEDAFSMPAALMKRWSKRYGEEEALRLARVGLEEVPLSLRVDGPSRDAFLAELEAVDAHPRAGRDASIVLLPSSETELALATKTFKSGQVSVQGEAALTAARRVEAKEGDRVLELCAAPGGKTVILARAGAKVLACDIHSGRLERVTENLERTGLQENVELRVSDGALGVPETDFDAVLIDAPCSNTGVLAQRPSARWRFGPKSQAALRELQERLLFEGADKVRSGGRLIYSTCSLEPDENALIVMKLIDQRPEFAMVRETKSMPHPETLQGPIDGGYVAQLSRS
ncbi:MAG: RsmB/NOP family class I SAM-dependent RNA methyltransferase, partial [Planctomycetota bacterium]